MIEMRSKEKGAWKREESAGGVVVREHPKPEFLAIKPAGYDRWQLPKGHVDPGEKPEEAALREVREEGGVDASIQESLGDIRYFFQLGGRRIMKIVHYFLMRYESGDPADHDKEVDEVRWFPLSEPQHLSFDNERQLIQKAHAVRDSPTA